MWIQNKTGKIANDHAAIRNMLNIQGPNILTDDDIAALGFSQVLTVAPAYDPLRQTATELAPAEVKGVWTQQWQIDDLDAAQIAINCKNAVAQRWAAITDCRDAREEAGFKCGEHWFHSDYRSQTKYLGLKDTARDMLESGATMSDVIQEQGQDILWHTLDNADVPMTVQLAFELVAAFKTLSAYLFAHAKLHRAALEASDRPDLYDFSAGWPATYKGD